MENIVLIFGGESTEREVSIVTASQIEKMCDRTKYRLLCVLIDENGKMLLVNEGIDVVECANVVGEQKGFKEVAFACGAIFKVKSRRLKKICDIDAAIIACHGGKGENGELVAALNCAKIKTSVGSPESLLIAMDKVLTKQLLKDSGVDVVDGVSFFENEWVGDRQKILKNILDLGYPVVVKPARQGSSVGVCYCKGENEVCDAVDLAVKFDNKILVEKAVKNFREFNVSVVCDGIQIIVSEVEQAIKSGEILSFEDKYLNGVKNCNFQKYEVKTPQNISFFNNLGAKFCKIDGYGISSSNRKLALNLKKSVSRKIKDFAIRATLATEIYGVSRIDFLVDEFDNVYLNEINAVPGSLAFYFWDKDSFFDRLVALAKHSLSDKKVCVAKFL